MKRLAIVGSGIAGLGLAYYLRDQFDITVFERDNRVGGHSHTVAVSESGREVPIDTGFMVFNRVTYPLLGRLFDELNVPTRKTDMSFSVQRRDLNLEYSGASFNRLFGDRSNLFNLRFWRLLLEINRFNEVGKTAFRDIDFADNPHETHFVDNPQSHMSLNEFISLYGLSNDFVEHYLVPMTGALWSTPPDKLRNFPVATLLRFFKNHGLLGQNSQHQWWTVDGGSREYVRRLTARLKQSPVISRGVVSVLRGPRKVTVTTSDGTAEEFDHVALACHADQALDLIQEPLESEREILGAFLYQRNETLLHTDPAVMPEEKRCWSSWNYRVDDHGSTHYWMNSLQNVSKDVNYFVTLNGEHLVDPSKVIRRMTYHHPLFDLRALLAQGKLDALNENSPREQVFFCGSYFGYGFHEDALRSAHKLASMISQRVPCF